MEQREVVGMESKEDMSKILEKLSITEGFKDVFFTGFLVN
jgi:hypothetical protein